MTLISIIVPVYKAEKYLPQCIESILAQTFSAIELILVDDGSPDKSGAICDEYAKKDTRIKVIHQPNSGVSVARNAALDVASGIYIMFCDSDDWVEPEWCECLYNAMQTPNVVMAACGHNEWDEGALICKINHNENDALMPLSEMFAKPISGVTWNKIFIREQITKHDIRFPIGISYGEDLRFILTYLSKFDGENEVFFSKSLLNNYRIVDGSLSHKYIKDFWKLEKEIIKMRCEVAKRHNTDLTKNQEQLYYYYYRLFYFSVRNLFKTKNDSKFLSKYKDLKEIASSFEFKEMQKSINFSKYPFWYKILIRWRVVPLLYIYHSLNK